MFCIGKRKEIPQIKFLCMLEMFMFACGYILHRLNILFGYKTKFFLSPVHVSTGSRLTLAGA